MTENTKMFAELRTEFGKGSARQARRDGLVPAVIYGHGAEPVHVLLPGREITLAVRTSNLILDLDVAGEAHLALVKEIQRHPLRQTVDHLDLLTVKRGEKVQVDVFLDVEGTVATGLVLSMDVNNVLVLADALALPERLVLNVEGRTAGNIHAGDVTLPEGTELEIDPKTVIGSVVEPAAEEEEPAAAAE